MDARFATVILDYDKLLKRTQEDMYLWVNQARAGGWSTNLVDPLLKKAEEIGLVRASYRELVETADQSL